MALTRNHGRQRSLDSVALLIQNDLRLAENYVRELGGTIFDLLRNFPVLLADDPRNRFQEGLLGEGKSASKAGMDSGCRLPSSRSVISSSPSEMWCLPKIVMLPPSRSHIPLFRHPGVSLLEFVFQQLRREWLRDVVGNSRLHRLFHLVIFGFRGEEDERNLARSLIRSHALE